MAGAGVERVAAKGPEIMEPEEVGVSLEEEAPVKRGFWGILKTVGSKIYQGLEYAGESIAEWIGLNDSEYQWAIDEHLRRKRQEDEYNKMIAEEEAERLEGMEGGAPTAVRV